jgi:hypothetical protein
MKRDQIDFRLNEILSDWHRWASRTQDAGDSKPHPMWSKTISARGWDTTADLIDGVAEDLLMESVDFAVGEMIPLHRTALQLEAKNLATGYAVWRSTRMPADAQERAKVLTEARGELSRRLGSAGVV